MPPSLLQAEEEVIEERDKKLDIKDGELTLNQSTPVFNQWTEL